MKIENFFNDYIRLVNDPFTKAELQQLEMEYIQKAPSDARLQHALLIQYVEKARKITKPSVVNKSAYEEIVWKHNSELDSPKID